MILHNKGGYMKQGKLTIFTSYTPGAGKSFLMISQAIKEVKKGRKIVIAFLNNSHRSFEQMKEILEIDDYTLEDISCGSCEKYSLNRVLALKPDIAVVDEMGMHGKNIDSNTFVYEDIEIMLQQGIDVYTSTNLKRFTSINNQFKAVTGIGIRKTIPDRFLERADEIYFLDREVDMMIADFQSGQLFGEKYMNSKIMRKNFKKETLKAYRDISIKYLMEKYREKTKFLQRE